jgi:hypothetical protein
LPNIYCAILQDQLVDLVMTIQFLIISYKIYYYYEIRFPNEGLAFARSVDQGDNGGSDQHIRYAYYTSFDISNIICNKLVIN